MRWFVLALSVLTAGATAAGEVIVDVVPASPQVRCEITAVSVTTASGEKKEIPLALPVVVTGSPSSIRLTLDESPAALLPIAKGCWAATLEVTPNSIIPPTVEMWPAGAVLGGISFERKGEEPTKIAGSFVDASGDRAEAVACELEAKVWRCAIPAGRPLHLKVAVDDFAPVFVWDLNVQPSAVEDTGIQVLVRGGAIAGRGVIDRNRPAAKAQVRLTALTAGHQSARDRSAKNLQTRTNAAGYFQFTGLEPGVYRLVSTIEGRGDAVIEAVEVRAGEHLELRDPLFHAELAELAVLLQPPVSPAQKPWSINLYRKGPRDSEIVSVANGPASVDGYWSKAGLQPTSYLLEVLDGSGSRLITRKVVLRGGREQITIDVATVSVVGKVVAGDEGIAAELTFEYGGRRVKTASDDEGAFRVDLPVSGSWKPAVIVGPSTVTLEPVEITSPQEDELLLRLPGGGVRGKVLGERGRGAEILVSLRRGVRPVAHTYADEEGTFKLIGIDEGEYTISAEAEESFAGPLPLTVGKDDTAEIDLRLESWKQVTGVVTTASGSPASGAVVRSFDPLTGLVEDTIADGRGTFSFKVMPRLNTIELVVLAPPHPIAMRRLPLGNRRVTSANVQLASEGTKLRVYVLRSPPWPTLTGPDGVTRSLGLLLMPLFGGRLWREFVDGGFNFFIEPGPYLVCGDANTPCRKLQLAAHAETTIDLATIPTNGAN